MKLNIPVGVSDFSQIRRGNFYYADKTLLIEELAGPGAAKVTLITRPRRFGKTLGMSMLAHFFDIRKNSAELFRGLAISENPVFCSSWMNQYPVIFFSFKDIDGLSFQNAYGQLTAQIATLYKEHAYLLDDPVMDQDDRNIFLALKAGEADGTQVSRSLSTLMRMMHNFYGKPVILLLDEYDVPAAKASSGGYYDEMLEVIKVMMSTALKDNSSLCFAVVTGCLRIAKESIFTGTNNLVADTITGSRFNEYFGFTQKEIDQILKDAGMTDYAAQIRQWYDGYHFGSCDVYCPWDVMNYIRDLQRAPHTQPASYWKNTSDNAIIRSFIDYAGSNITKKMETLLSGGYIVQKLDENLTYDYLHASEDNLWSVLYLTGYLTCVRESELPGALPEGMTALRIPNQEIREIYETTVIRWFDESAKTWNRAPLFDAVWKGDSESLTREMTKLLRRTISYYDYGEDFYHAFLAGIFAGAGYAAESNREHGEGRSDVVVYDEVNARVAVFEAKSAATMDEMASACDAALQQIDDRMYADSFEDDYDEIFCYGISFFKKRCLVKARRK